MHILTQFQKNSVFTDYYLNMLNWKPLRPAGLSFLGGNWLVGVKYNDC